MSDDDDRSGALLGSVELNKLVKESPSLVNENGMIKACQGQVRSESKLNWITFLLFFSFFASNSTQCIIGHATPLGSNVFRLQQRHLVPVSLSSLSLGVAPHRGHWTRWKTWIIHYLWVKERTRNVVFRQKIKRKEVMLKTTPLYCWLIGICP